jgi:amino acid adenylation domain-containing protein
MSSTLPASAPRPAELADAKRALLERRLQLAATGRSAIPQRAPGVEPPLSFAQERLWFMEQYAPGTTAYSIPTILDLEGDLDHEALHHAFTAVVERHETLRMDFPPTPEGQPTVRIRSAAEVSWQRVDVSGEVDPDAQALELLAAEGARPFDVASGPLVRTLLVRVRPEHHLLLVVVHHIVSDGWSTNLLAEELVSCYQAARRGQAPDLPELPVQYGDLALWQRQQLDGAVRDQHLSFWRDQLAGVQPLELPADHPRPPVQTFDGASYEFRGDLDLLEGLDQLGRAQGTTLYMTLLAAFQTLLARYSGQSEFAVGSPIAGRDKPETERLIGMFVNMLTLKASVDGDPTFAELLARTRATVLDAFSHQDLPFEQLVNELQLPRDVSRTPLFQAVFSLHNFEIHRFSTGDEEGRQLSVGWYPLPIASTRWDLQLQAVSLADGLRFTFTYNTALFTEATIERLARHLLVLLHSVVAAPGARLSELTLMDEAEQQLVLSEWNATDGQFPSDSTLSALIEAQVARTPDATAVAFEGETVTFAELDRRANQVAGRLRGLGVGPETLVGVCAERSLELVVGLLGVLKSGAAYVPLDPEYPADRLAFMVADSAAPVLLTQRKLAAALPPTDARVLVLDDEAEWDDHGVRATQAGEPSDPLPQQAQPHHAAYVIYTSGSTGRPKGVPNTHRGIVNRLDWMQKAYGLGADDVVLQKTPASFDVSVWEFFWPLVTGARLVLARPGGHKDPAYLRDIIVAEGVTTAHFVPSMLAVFLPEGVEGCLSLRRVICSGEELPVAVARDFLRRLPACELHNLYGPTEAAVDVTSWPCDSAALAEAATVPIGRPIQNMRLYVLDNRSAPVPVGVPGELHIAGVGLARGYLNRPELTAEKFVPNPYGEPGSRLYRTGDLARWRADGTLEYLGRIDHQVKLRGLRIELGEIESVLRNQAQVRDAVVIVREDVPGDKRLVAYLLAESETEPDPAALRTVLKEGLPDYMVPTAFVTLGAFPTTPNGKLDRKALPAPTTTRSADRGRVEPSTDTERLVASLWSEVLGVDDVGAEDDFFDLGGHSMLATQVVAKLRQRLKGAGQSLRSGHAGQSLRSGHAGQSLRSGHAGRQVGVMDLFKNRTVAELAALIERPADDDEPRRLVHELTKPVPAAQRVLSLVCVPYGGGSAVVYQPLADALPAGHSLYSVAIPGHDVGLDEEPLPFDELARRCTEEILAHVEGPLALYGHCGVGGALIVELARRLEAAGRRVEAVYTGAVFPFARSRGRLSRLQKRFQKLASNRNYANWLKSMGVDMDELDPAQADRIIANMRHDGDAAEAFFTDLLEGQAERLRAPFVSVVGEKDPITDYYQERYKEWHFLTDTTAVVVLEEAGHFFLKYRAAELVEIITRTHAALNQGTTGELPATPADSGWWLAGVDGPSDKAEGTAAADKRPAAPAVEVEVEVEPSMRRFLAVAAGQLISLTGSALTGWALPIWIYLQNGSVAGLGVLITLGLVPGLVLAPVAGAVIDRYDRRKILLLCGVAAGGAELALVLALWMGEIPTWAVYAFMAWLSAVQAFQRLAYTSAIPQLVPKRFLGNATGLAQFSTGFALLLAPLAAAGMLAAIGLGGILVVDIASYTFAIIVLALVRFPDRMGWRRKEAFGAEIVNGFRFSWGNRHFRSLLIFFAGINLFLGAPIVLTAPLVLSFGTLGDVGLLTVVEGLAAVIGACAFAVWGGPKVRRALGVVVTTYFVIASCALIGLHPSVPVVASGVFGMMLSLALTQATFLTIIQVKVPQRFHGRVFAITQMIAWSTLPIGFAVIAPLGTNLFEPLLQPGGGLASTVGAVIGVGEGRGIAFVYIVSAVAMLAVTLAALRYRVFSRFDAEAPDALPDDLEGIRERQRRRAVTAGEPEPEAALAPVPPAEAVPALAAVGTDNLLAGG